MRNPLESREPEEPQCMGCNPRTFFFFFFALALHLNNGIRGSWVNLACKCCCGYPLSHLTLEGSPGVIVLLQLLYPWATALMHCLGIDHVSVSCVGVWVCWREVKKGKSLCQTFDLLCLKSWLCRSSGLGGRNKRPARHTLS